MVSQEIIMLTFAEAPDQDQSSTDNEDDSTTVEPENDHSVSRPLF